MPSGYPLGDKLGSRFDMRWSMAMLVGAAAMPLRRQEDHDGMRTPRDVGIQMTEEALLLARVTQDTRPISLTAEAMTHLIESETAVLDS